MKFYDAIQSITIFFNTLLRTFLPWFLCMIVKLCSKRKRLEQKSMLRAAEARFLAHKRATSYYWNLRVIKAKHVQNKSHYIEKCWQAYSAQTVLVSFGNCQNSESDYDHESKWIRGQKGHYMLHSFFFSFFAKWQITNIPKRWNMAVKKCLSTSLYYIKC